MFNYKYSISLFYSFSYLFGFLKADNSSKKKRRILYLI